MKTNKLSKRVRRLFIRAKEMSKEKRIYYVISIGIKRIVQRSKNSFWYYYYKTFKSSRNFTFQGETYSYFYHKYNKTWRNERAVEVPIIWEIVKKHQGKRILEVGNVLSHYFSVSHDIIDKYEKADSVINQDVVDFQPNKKYDLIVSISTLEHVGWDEEPRDPMKILRAIQNLENLFASETKIVVTLPLGYNTKMDKLLKEGKIHFSEQYCLKRISRDNRWIEVNWNDIREAKYGSPFPSANGLIIGIIEKFTSSS